jgi:hypothetical protein
MRPRVAIALVGTRRLIRSGFATLGFGESRCSITIGWFCDTGNTRLPVFHNVPVFRIPRPMHPVTTAVEAAHRSVPTALGDQPINRRPRYSDRARNADEALPDPEPQPDPKRPSKA